MADEATPQDAFKPVLDYEVVATESDHVMLRFINPDYTGRYITTEKDEETEEETPVDNDPFQHLVVRVNLPMKTNGQVDADTWKEWLFGQSLSAQHLMAISKARYLATKHKPDLSGILPQ